MSDQSLVATVTTFRVRWAECDPAGIIYHARAFDWFSEGRLAWLEARHLSYYDVLRARGVDLLVMGCDARFLHMLRPGDRLSLTTRVGALTPTRLHFMYAVEAGGRAVIEGATRHVFVAGGHAINLKKRHPDIYEALLASLGGGGVREGD